MALKRMEPSQGAITLGVSIAMDGNHRDEKLYLEDKAGEYADQLRAGLIKKEDAWYSFKSSFLKTLEYPMEAVSLLLADWDKVVHLWLQPPHTWKFRYSPSQDHLFFRLGHIWSVLRRTTARLTRRLHQGVFGILIDANPALPKDLVRADMSRRRARFILHSVGDHLQVPLRPVPLDLDSCLPSIPLFDQWALDEI
jgi:hypothetical protein